MRWMERIFGSRQKSSATAKKRLQMVLIHDRSDVSPGLLELIKDDIVEVIAKHLDIKKENVVINLEQTSTESMLVAEVPLLTNGRAHRSS
jgi:cell division topological specificity factor